MNNENNSLLDMFGEEQKEMPNTAPPTSVFATSVETTPVVVPTTEAPVTSAPPVANPTIPIEEKHVVKSAPINDPNAPINAQEAELIRAFVGQNCDKIASGGFNFCAFFFGAFWFFYRKMFLIGTCYIIINVISNIIFSNSILFLVIDIAASLLANQMYMNFALKKVKEIEAQNPECNQQQLIEICQMKGGTSWGYVFLSFGVSLVVGIIGAIFSIIFQLSTRAIVLEVSPSNRSAKDVFIIENYPATFINVPNEENFSFRYNGCAVSLSNDANSSISEAIQGYQKIKGDSGIIVSKTVNGIHWNGIWFGEKDSVAGQHYYFTDVDGSIFKLSFTNTSSGPEDCFASEGQFLKAIQKKDS